MKKRNLSGIYFRHKLEDGTFDNVCFEDLPLDKQKEIVNAKNLEWVQSLSIQLSESITDLMKYKFDENDLESLKELAIYLSMSLVYFSDTLGIVKE